MDHFGFQKSPVGQWIVRTFAGEGESIFEGLFSFRQRIGRKSGSLAEAYGWGKFIGMLFPWIIDWASRLAGIDVYGIEAFYIPYFYALSDQMGANVSGFIFFKRKEKTFGKAFLAYIRNPVMLTSLLVILVAPIGLLLVRVYGFSPTTQIKTSLETIAANLCWLPVVVGYFSERKKT